MALFNFLHVINTWSLSFFIDAGNTILNGVNLYVRFLCFLSILGTLPSSIFIWIGLSSPTISKFCWARIITVSIGSCIGSFLFLPTRVRVRLWIFLSFRIGKFPLTLVTWKLKESLFVFFLTKNFIRFSGLIILNISFFVFLSK